MVKCVKVLCTVVVTKNLLTMVQKTAQKLSIEGALHMVPPDVIKIVACGSKENIEVFVDVIYKEIAKKKPFGMEVEPFIKDKDYRGIFRIIQ